MTDFGRWTLPWCSFVKPGAGRPHVGIGIDSGVLDLTLASPTLLPEHAGLFADGSLDRLLAAGPDVWTLVREALLAHEPAELLPQDAVTYVLPFAVADYVDFYASEHHATHVGRMFRPDGEPLPHAWKHLPVAYHGRAGTVVVSETPVVRPSGLRLGVDGAVTFGPTRRLDLEAEIGFVVGAPSVHGAPVPIDDFERHVFGVCIVNDWSARDVQAFETVPLGPMLGKSFSTSVSPWVVPLAALADARTAGPAQDPEPVAYLRGSEPWGLDLELTIRVNDTVVSRPPFSTTYWSPAQMLAHLTVNGASLRTGDLYASGTVSGPGPDQLGSLLELSDDGRRAVPLDDGTARTFLEDGDHVTLSSVAVLADGRRLEMGEVTGVIVPATPPT